MHPNVSLLHIQWAAILAIYTSDAGISLRVFNKVIGLPPSPDASTVTHSQDAEQLSWQPWADFKFISPWGTKK